MASGRCGRWIPREASPLCGTELSDDAGVPLRSVSGRVGHRNPSTTTNIYAHWIQASDTRSAKVVEDRVWGSAKGGRP